MASDGPLVLGIETSCDETGVGVVRGTTLLADAVASSVDEHARFGGVVPEVASRAHLEAMVPTIERACRDAGVALRDLDAISVTSGPGLAGSLLVGVLKEIDPREKRVAGTPASVERLQKLGLRVIVESGAGAGAGFEDAAYAEAGARVEEFMVDHPGGALRFTPSAIGPDRAFAIRRRDPTRPEIADG